MIAVFPLQDGEPRRGAGTSREIFHLGGGSAMPFDLTIKQCHAGPGRSYYIFRTSRDKARLIVVDVTQTLNLGDGFEAVLIGYKKTIWLYFFQSNKYPPQEPKLLLNAKEDLSIEGAGTAILLKSVSLRAAMAELAGRFPEISDGLMA
jgi:hypothetical protein